MKLFLDGHNLEFAAQQIYMCMFPNSHAEFVSEKPEDGDFIVSKLCQEGKEFFSETEIYLSGIKSVGKAEFKIPDSNDAEEEKRTAKRAIKTSFYRASLKHLSKEPAWGALTGVRPSKVAAKYIEQGFSEADATRLMGEDYFVTPSRASLAVKCAIRADEMAKSTGERDMSLYIGIPFCASRCRYCSFVSHSIEKARGLVAPYLEMLTYELCGLADAVKETGLHLRSIYIGGGTPTALECGELSYVLDTVSKNFDLSEVFEYTVEGGRPDTLSIDKIRAIRAGGATRISVNPQTMNDEILRAMDRRHTAADVVRAVEDVRRVGGLMINTDLIAGLPGDTFDSFKNSVDRMTELSPENITVHTLAIKKGSELHREKYILPDGETTENMVDYAMKTLGESGYIPYYLYRQKYMSGNLENVGYSKPGCESAYNNYIMDELHSIVSAGAGGVTKLIARSRGEIERIFNPKYPYEYNNATEKIDTARKRIKEFFANRGDRQWHLK